MQPSESPFPCHWWGIDLEDAGLEDESRTQNDVQIAFGFGFPVGR